MDLEFKELTDFGRGLMFDILKDAYAFEEQYAACWEANWRETDDFFYDHPDIADRYGFVTCLAGEPIGFISWDPRHRRTAYKGRGFGKAQLKEALWRIPGIRRVEGDSRLHERQSHCAQELRERRVCTV